MSHAHPQDPVTSAVRALEGRTIVAAVSGGPDSMALLHALSELARERALRVIAAHFDHRLRARSYRDLDFVRRAADKLEARVAAGHGDVRTHAYATRQSIEAAGRELRYAFLERIADQTGADLIATGHTRDDQVETVLMRIMRGASARGRRGILTLRGRIARPLLSVQRTETEAYCQAHGIPVIKDPSNFDRRFERNRVRHDVLPHLRGVFPGIDDALLRIARAAHDEFVRADAATARRLQIFLQPESPRAWLLQMGAFTGLDDPVDRSHLLSAALDAMSARSDVTSAHHEQLLALLGAGVGAVTDLPGVRVRREHDGLVFTRRGSALACDVSVHTLAVPGTVDVGGWHLDARPVGAPSAGQLLRSGKKVAFLHCDDSLIVRLPRQGDRMRPFGMSGHKKLSDIFIDQKIPQRMRARTPVVESRGEILWLVGVATSEFARVDTRTPGAIRVTATRMERA